MNRITKLRGLVTSAFCAALVLAPASAWSQTAGVVRGRVVDGATTRPLSGAQVFVVGTTRGIITNASGEYTISGLALGRAVLRTRMIGYADQDQTVEVTAGEGVRADFSLATSVISLNEVVVTGTPGAAQKRTIGNAVSTIRAAEILEKAPITSVDQLLMARTPGLTLMPGAGSVGTSSNINIRGSGSLNAGNRPVFFVDGIRIQTEARGTMGVSGQDRNPLDHLNPDDIESIEVIKGPAASTLYGAEAASGVIQIITKKGAKGQPNVHWSARLEAGSIEWSLPMRNTYHLCTPADIRGTTYPGCAAMDSLAPAATRLLTDNPFKGCDPVIQDPRAGLRAFCQKDPTALRSGDLQRYSLSARGGGERFAFFASFDRDQENGVFFNNDFGRNAGRVNFQATVLDNLDFNFSSTYSKANSRLPLNDNASNGLLRNAWRSQPGRNDPWEKGYLGLGPDQINRYLNTQDDERVMLATTTNYKPWNWFSSRLTMGLDYLGGVAFTQTEIDLTGRSPWGATSSKGTVDKIRGSNYVWTVDYAGTASHTLSDEMSSALSVGVQYTATRYRNLRGTGEGLASNIVNLVGNAAITRSTEARTEQNSVGVYVQEQVAWRDRLFVTGAVRADDNSAFGQNFDLAIFPKLQASYIISDEPFFSLPHVDELKLRGSFGRAGNSPSPFSADRNYQSAAATFIDGTSTPVLTTDSYGNPDLKAESGQEFEIGFDAGLLGGRAGAEVTYYNQHTKDALISVPVAPSSGFSGNVLRNMGEISNSGFEIALFGTPINRRSFSWDTRVALSTNRNDLLSLGGRDPIVLGAFSSVQRHIPGYPLAGYWYTLTERDASGKVVIDPVTNRARLQTHLVNGVAVVDTFFLGPSQPTRELSLTNTFTILGNLRFYVYADYKGGHYMWSAQEFVNSTIDFNTLRVNDPNGDPQEMNGFRNGGTRPYFDNADFIKLREISLTYTLPSVWIQRFGASQASISVAGRNLGIWTKYDLGSDPELNFGGDGTFTRTDYMSVPMLRRFVTSINLSF